MLNPVILFIPVSSTEGVGEYSRSLMLAKALQQDLPDANINFILNKYVSYIKDCPFETHLTEHSATKDTPNVIKTIKALKPDLVIFDCSGRARQYAAAKLIGAKVIFISQHKRKRARGIMLRRLVNIDRHWVVQPDFAITPLSLMEKIKLRVLNRPAPTNLGSILPRINTNNTDEVFSQYGIKDNNYFIFSAGSGGHIRDDVLVSDIFYQAAIKFQQQTGISCIVIFGVNYPNEIPKNSKVICIQSLSTDVFMCLVKNAIGRVLGAGDTLLQAISLEKASVATVISKDQPQRLLAAQHKRIVLASELNVDALLNQSVKLLNKQTLTDIQTALKKQSKGGGLEQAVGEIKQLLGIKGRIQRRYLFYISQDYSFEIIRPIQEVILEQGDECAWHVEGNEVNLENFRINEKRLNKLEDAITYCADAVLAPGNHVPTFIPGVKVSVFHGLEWKKKGHFRIRGFFDLYCTHGEITTTRFNELKRQHGYFEVTETGWPKLDPLYQTKPISVDTKLPVILFAPTFSPNLTCAVECLEEIKRLIAKKQHYWMVKFHPKMSPEWIALYREISAPNFVIIESASCLPLLQRADVLLSDTSSIISEFLLMNKPVVTYKNAQPGGYLIDVRVIEGIEGAIDKAFTGSSELVEKIKAENEKLHPYNDGKSSQRLLAAIEPLIQSAMLIRLKKPLNLLRNFKLRQRLNYWKF